jgi:hypothetical protein
VLILAGGFDRDAARAGLRFGNGLAVSAEAFDVERDRLAYQLLDFLNGITGSDTTRKVRDVGGVRIPGPLDDDEIRAHLPSPLRPV